MEQAKSSSEVKNAKRVVIVKIGGSSVTNKATKESVNEEYLDWFARTVSDNVGQEFKGADAAEQGNSQLGAAFILIHGAGSFGHHSAKEYGLSGQTGEPDVSKVISIGENRHRKRGLAETRLSVQKLNHLVVSKLIEHGVNAVGISPGFGIPGLEAHLHLQPEAINILEEVVLRTINAGLVPVMHGDACMYGSDAAILSGDTLVEVLGSLNWVSDAIFITDVDGVYDEDPRQNPNAKLLPKIFVDPESGSLMINVKASGSSHEHDVTGGLKTKLKAAARIAMSKTVTIVGCGSKGFAQTLRGEDVELGTAMSPKEET
ncbi:MAG: hypothetical protein SGBAC_000016 [Bacillariaceae sp.]